MGRHVAFPRPVLATLALALGALGLAPLAGADSIEDPLSDARSSFDKHSRSWMANLEKNEAENRRTAPVYQVASETVIRFDGYGDDYEMTIKETGRPSTPFVGVLRYEEVLYTCLRDDAARCTVTRSVPVSEIFSFRNGRWAY